MPCSHMMSMNCIPLVASDDSSTARLPAANARIRKSFRLIIGSFTRVSTRTNTTRTAAPPAIMASTKGLDHPMLEVP